MSIRALRTNIRSVPPRWRKTLFWILGAIITYTVVGFLILPPIVKAVAVKQLSSLLDREVLIRRVAINPYVLSGAIRGLLIRDKDGEPFVSWDEAYANFQLVSFFGKPWVFKEIRLKRPFARVQINQDRSLNFDDLLKKFAAAPPEPPEKKKPLFLHISRVQITGASASWTDLTPSKPFRLHLGPLQVTLTELRTDPNSKAPFSLSGTTESGEKFSWSGYFLLDPLFSEGQLSVTGLSLSKYAPLYQDLVRFEIKDGIVDLASGYRLGLDASNNVAEVSHGTLSLKSLKVAEKNSDRNLVELDKLAINDVNGSLVKLTGDVTSLLGEGARLDLRRGKDGKINLLQMISPAETTTKPPRSVMLALQGITNFFALLSLSTNAGSAALHQLRVTNGLVDWADLATPRPVSLRLDNIALTGRELSNLPGSNMTAGISLRWNTNGTIRTETTAQLSPPAADGTLGLNNVELAPISPYLESFVNLALISAKLGLDSQMRVRMTNEVLDAKLTADLRLDDFATVDGLMKEDLVKWKSLHVSGLEANLVPPEATIKQIELVEPLARVVIATNRIINVVAAFKKAGDSNAPPAQLAGTTAPPATNSTPADGKSGLKQEANSFSAGAGVSRTNGAASSVPPVTVSRFVINNATLEYSDQSTQPPVNASVRAINATITDLSTKDSERADLNLEGRVEGTGLVKIAGKTEPLHPTTATDLRVSIHEVDLKPASPYVGKYAGYRLNRGKFNLDLDGGISQNKLSTSNHLVLDQFTLGEKVDSTNATHLPVRLGVALLKDRSGKITLDLPIAGSFDDPKFRVGGVLAQTVGDLITKVTTSPLSILGAVVGGNGEELGYQEFAPGSAELQPAARKKLEALVKGLDERPGLGVEIEGSVDPKADGERLGANDDLKHLARRRAERVKEYLLQVGKVDGERIFFTEESEAKVTDKGCRAYLHLR